MIAPVTPAPPKSPALKQPATAMFGRIDGNGRFLRLSVLQAVKGKNFGWRVRLPCLGPVEFTETMKLPAPGDWRGLDLAASRETTISKDGMVATTHDYVACYDGWIDHSWSLSERDPLGDWTVTLEIPGYAPLVWPIHFVK